MAPGDLRQSLHVGRVSVEVHDQQGGGTLGDLALDIGDIDVPGVRLAVRKDRDQAVPARRVSRREKGEAGDYNFSSEAKGALDQHQAASTAGYRDAVLNL